MSAPTDHAVEREALNGPMKRLARLFDEHLSQYPEEEQKRLVAAALEVPTRKELEEKVARLREQLRSVDAEILKNLRRLQENPWDTIVLRYDAGEWGIDLHEDGGRDLTVEPGEILLDRLQEAVLLTQELRREEPSPLAPEASHVEAAAPARTEREAPAPADSGTDRLHPSEAPSLPPLKVEIYERGDRGFHGYGEPMKDTYGSLLEVYESSAAGGPHVWVKVDASAWDRSGEPARATAHLNVEQARALIARVQAFLDEIPSRWSDR